MTLLRRYLAHVAAINLGRSMHCPPRPAVAWDEHPALFLRFVRR